MDWQELLIGKQARITPIGLAYDCPLHVSAPGTLHGITLRDYAPVYFCTVCHRAFSAREMALLLRVRAELPEEEPVTSWLWRVRGSNPPPYWRDAPIRAPLARQAIGARDLVDAFGDLQATREQRRRLAKFLHGSARSAVVLVHTAGYDGVATSLTLARPNKGASWPVLPLYTGVTGFLPFVTSGIPAAFVPNARMVLVPETRLADLGIAGSPRLTHADGSLYRAVDWRGSIASVIRCQPSNLAYRQPLLVGAVTRTAVRVDRRPVLRHMIAWMCAVVVASRIAAPIQLRVTLSKRVSDKLLAYASWYTRMAGQLGLSFMFDRYTRLAVHISLDADRNATPLHLDLGKALLKHTPRTIRPPQAWKLRKAIAAAVKQIGAAGSDARTLLVSAPGEFVRRLVTGLASDSRKHVRVTHNFTEQESAALLALSAPTRMKEISCAS